MQTIEASSSRTWRRTSETESRPWLATTRRALSRATRSRPLRSSAMSTPTETTRNHLALAPNSCQPNSLAVHDRSRPRRADRRAGTEMAGRIIERVLSGLVRHIAAGYRAPRAPPTWWRANAGSNVRGCAALPPRAHRREFSCSCPLSRLAGACCRLFGAAASSGVKPPAVTT